MLIFICVLGCAPTIEFAHRKERQSSSRATGASRRAPGPGPGPGGVRPLPRPRPAPGPLARGAFNVWLESWATPPNIYADKKNRMSVFRRDSNCAFVVSFLCLAVSSAWVPGIIHLDSIFPDPHPGFGLCGPQSLVSPKLGGGSFGFWKSTEAGSAFTPLNTKPYGWVSIQQRCSIPGTTPLHPGP